MKKLAIFSVVWMLLAGCSDRELMTGKQDDVPAESSFLSVSIVASGAGTRAADEEYGKEEGKYKDGTAAENYVEKVLFLFFDKDGKPTEAFKNGSNPYQTYYLWNVSQTTNDEAGQDHEGTVEKILKENIRIAVPHGQAKPAQLFAVVNPTDNYTSELVGKTLDQLKEIVNDYETYNNTSLSKKGTFVMTNSVYYESTGENKEIIYTTKIKESDYKDDAEEAAKNPVIVYVERVLARIDLKIDIDNTQNRKEGKDEKGTFYYYYTGKTIEDGTTGYTDGEDIYVRFLGWNVFDTPSKSRLIKSIGDASWDKSNFFGNGLPWNSPDFHRSFWAVNPAADKFVYKKGSIVPEANLDKDGNEDEIFKDWYANNNKVPAPGDKPDYVTAYFQENAAPFEAVESAPVKPSKVILAAQLVDKDGKPRELAKWAGKYYPSWNSLATQLCNGVLDLYYNAGTTTDATGTTTTYHKIKPEHLAYTPSDKSSYKLTVSLADEAKGLTWYKVKDGVTGTPGVNDLKEVTNIEANTYIETITGDGTVMLWSQGYTYFYFTIRHLGETDTPAYYGVVRNHIYDATVKSVKGLGTPVSDPNDTITDVTPPDEETGILAAQVRILSWRLVTQSYDLNW